MNCAQTLLLYSSTKNEKIKKKFFLKNGKLGE